MLMSFVVLVSLVAVEAVAEVEAVAVVPMAAIAAAMMMMQEILWMVSKVTSLAMIIMALTKSGKAVRLAVRHFFHEHRTDRNLLFGLLHNPCMSHVSCIRF